MKGPILIDGTTLLHATSVACAAHVMQRLYTTPIIYIVCGYNLA